MAENNVLVKEVARGFAKVTTRECSETSWSIIDRDLIVHCHTIETLRSQKRFCLDRQLPPLAEFCFRQSVIVRGSPESVPAR